MDATSNLTLYRNNMVPATFFLRCSFSPDNLPLPKKLPLKLLPVRHTPEGAKGYRTFLSLSLLLCVPSDSLQQKRRAGTMVHRKPRPSWGSYWELQGGDSRGHLTVNPDIRVSPHVLLAWIITSRQHWRGTVPASHWSLFQLPFTIKLLRVT